MNYTAIENQIIAQADSDTALEIQKIVDQIGRLINESGKSFQTEIRWHGSDHKVSLPFRGMVLPLVKEILKDEITQKRRDRALKEFLGKFNAVVSQIENLGIELEGISQQQSEES